MATPALKLYPSAPLESIKNDALELRLWKKTNDGNSFNSSVKHIKEMVTYFKDKNGKTKKRYIKHKKHYNIKKRDRIKDIYIYIKMCKMYKRIKNI